MKDKISLLVAIDIDNLQPGDTLVLTAPQYEEALYLMLHEGYDIFRDVHILVDGELQPSYRKL